MMERTRVYLDHAATSWPKSEAVCEAMDRFFRDCGAAAGRGGYQSAASADQIVAITRRSIAALIGAVDAQCVTLHSNGTAALNAAIHGLVRPGDHVVTTAAEHNSVLRPLHHLVKHADVRMTVVPVDTNGLVDIEEIVAAVDDQTRMVTLTHASNVTGAVQNVAALGERLRDRDAIFLCDAAQTFGTIPIDVSKFHIDLLAAPGHKASGGPLGTAFLYIDRDVHDRLVPSIQGGTGSQSESLEMPTTMPAMMEAGNLNVPALAGWAEALQQLSTDTVEDRQRQARTLARHLHQGLDSIEEVRVFGESGELPIASVAIEGLSPTDLAMILDAEYGVETRAGLHCAALIHDFLGSHQEGTLRLSGGHTTTLKEIDTAIDALRSVVQTLHSH